MMQVITKWIVSVYRGEEAPIVFGYSDMHPENVLRAVAQMDFGRDVRRVEVIKEQPLPQNGITTFSNI